MINKNYCFCVLIFNRNKIDIIGVMDKCEAVFSFSFSSKEKYYLLLHRQIETETVDSTSECNFIILQI